MPNPVQFGGSAPAIRHHYDAGDAFYAGWLDASMTYSCALWDGLAPGAPLEDAQANKLRYHADAAGARPGARVLDVGCGWGSMLATLVRERGAAEAVGLTLSENQHAHVARLGLPNTEVRLESWADYQPARPFDGIVSIGAFEHFADPAQTRAERIAVYRTFFERCKSWLVPGGRLSLQTIAYGTLSPEQSSAFMTESIFPNAELPYLSDVVLASEGTFEVRAVRNDRLDYALTCEEWGRRLRRRAKDASPAERETYATYDRYLRLSSAGFRMGKIVLLRLAFELPGWKAGARA